MSHPFTGADIAKSCHWDGERIFAVSMDALTDANFHELRAKLESRFADWLYQEQAREREEMRAQP